MRKKAKYLGLLLISGILFGCAEPEVPEVKEYVPSVVEKETVEENVTYMETEVWEQTEQKLELFENRMLELAEIGEELTFGDFDIYEVSLKNEEDTPDNCNRYVYTKGGARYQLVITWEEGIEPKKDTPLVSAVLSLVSDPTISADIMRENPAIVTNVVVRPGGK